MKITRTEWNNYVEKLSKLSDKASKEFADWAEKNGGWSAIDRQVLAEVGWSIASKYAEGSSALAAEMYDAIAYAEKANVPQAELAADVEFKTVAKAINGALKTSTNDDFVSSTVGRAVKQAGADTMLKNASRDQAEFAWIPSGDSCPFCLVLASNGWRRASKKTVNGGHAEHIHTNCNCQFAIRFNKDFNVEGYKPEEYQRIYYNAEGSNYKEKVNSIRRDQEAERKRRMDLGEPIIFSRIGITITARPINRFSNNNVYLADDVELNNKELRYINTRINSSKEILDIQSECEIPIVIVNDDKDLAAYNPVSNTLFISSRMKNAETILELQEGYAASQNVDSTFVHELIHWQDAEEYRKDGKSIDDASPKSEYSIYQREKAMKLLEEAGINISDPNQIYEISPYASENMVANNYEEIYTEYRTKLIFEKGQ